MSLTKPDKANRQPRPAKRLEEGFTGSSGQIDWAKLIKPRVDAEFDRVANAFRDVAGNPTEQDRTDTEAVIAILEEKRTEVMARREAGYFIRHWRDLNDQVRRMIADDARYQAIQAAQASRRA